MQATVEPLEGNRVKLSVEVEEDEFSKALDDALAEVAASIRMPGFRPGRAPKKLVESRIGKGALREEALRDALPGYVRRAAEETGTDAIGRPEVEVTSTAEDPVLRFDAVVEIRPKPSIAGYAGLSVTVPSPEATSEEVDRQIDRLREQFGQLSDVARPARAGDHLTVDVAATRNGEADDELSVEDFVAEVGSGALLPSFDEQLTGAKAGDVLTLSAPHPEDGEEVSYRILVKEVKEKVLPEADDAWASEASEFATMAELRADVVRRISDVKKISSKMALRSEAAKELTELVLDEVPDVLVAEEMEIRLSDLQRRLQAQGATIQQYLAATSQDAQSFTDGLRQAAVDTVKLDLALRSLADAESIEASDGEVDERIHTLAERAGSDPDHVRARLEESHGLDAVRWEIRKAKALDWLEEHVEVVDEEGRTLDRALLEPSPDETAESDPTSGASPSVDAPPAGTLES